MFHRIFLRLCWLGLFDNWRSHIIITQIWVFAYAVYQCRRQYSCRPGYYTAQHDGLNRCGREPRDNALDTSGLSIDIANLYINLTQGG